MMHLQKKFRTESWGNIVKEAMERLWAGDRGDGYGIVCPVISEVTLRVSPAWPPNREQNKDDISGLSELDGGKPVRPQGYTKI